ncbi:hypothetical protein [Dysgonomonas sp. 25]|uniref:hypothetical protein n=1 Tax=Dysgonomonas sp. 25 TaxID=2302933 RepID=UPI0013D34A1B|nr:hypothetical protein [Dysgonomonas sp. 25]NDV67898.1 hypothetical protein [Dysgonomonas sp. 25]
MLSKETIRKQILSYAELIWGTKKIERADFLVRLLVEELTEELYRMQNSINNIELTLLEKLAAKLTPPEYLSIRPAHGIFQIKTTIPQYILGHQIPFYLNDKPDYLKEKEIENIIFHPVTDTKLFNIKVDYVFNSTNLYMIDNAGNKQIKCRSPKKSYTNSIWLGLSIDKNIENLKGLSIYIDFPHLSEIHDYYEVIHYTDLIIEGKPVKLTQGFPTSFNIYDNTIESNILAFYEKNYLTIDENLFVESLYAEPLPSELIKLFEPDEISDMVPKYWIQVKFHFYIQPEDLTGVVVALNTFPAYNKTTNNQKVNKEYLKDTVALYAERSEKLLGLTSVIDSNKNKYSPYDPENDDPEGSYHIEPVNNIYIQSLDIADYLEQLTDLIDNEKTAFPKIDTDKIFETVNSITSVETGVGDKLDSNDQNNQKIEIDRMLVHPMKKADSVNIIYETTLGELANDIPAGVKYIPQLETQTGLSDAINLTPVCGGKEFSDLEDLLAINKYLLASNDRLITNFNIISFCETELGKLIEKVEIELTSKVSPRPKEGIIKTIEVKLFPSDRYPDLLYKRGILRDLLMRMKLRSPHDYDYTIQIGSSYK